MKGFPYFSGSRIAIVCMLVTGLMIAAFMSFSGAPYAGAAAPLAGTVIGNQASATYTDASLINRTATSNTVTTTVQQVASFTLTANQLKMAAPGATVYYPHTLSNTGNGSDSFNLTVVDANTGTINLTLYIYADADGDGVPDNSTPISGTGSVAPGGAFKFVVAAVVPGSATSGQAETITVTGTSVFNGAVSQTNTDTVTVTGNAVINVTKSLSIISGPSPSTGNITVTLTYTNTGNSAASNVTITDAIGVGATSGMAYVANSGGWSGGATVTDAAGGDSAGLSYDWNVTTPSTVRAVISSIAPATSGTISFQVSINSGIAPGTAATSNKAVYSYNDGSGNVGPFDSNTATYTVLQTGGTVANGSNSSSVDGTGEPVTVASATQGSTVSFSNYIWNTGNGTDSFDITISAGAPAFPAGTTFQLYQSDSVTPLTDTNGNGIPDTGPVAPGANYTVVLKATLPANATGGPFSVTKTSTSFFDSSRTNTVSDTLTSIASSTVDITNNTARTDSTPAGTANSGNAGTTGWGTGPEVVPVITNSVNPGGSTTFVLVLNNTSSVADSYDMLADKDGTFGASNDLPSGWTLVFKRDNSGAARDCSATGATITNTGVINAGANRVFCAIITVPAAQAAGDQDIYFRGRSSTTGAADINHDRVTVNAVRSIAASPNNSGQIYPGGTVVYTHLLTNTGNVVEGDGTGSTITLSRADSLSGWTSVIYFDLNNDGALDAGDPVASSGIHILGGALSDGLGIGESARFFVKVFAPAGAAMGDIDMTTLTASTANGTYTTTAPAASSAQDTTQVIAGQVRMEKKQALDATCDGTADAAYSSSPITAAPGVCIRYQIVAMNDGTANITSLIVSDATPPNTTYDDGSRNSAQGVCGTGAVDAAAATTQGTITAPACGSSGTVQATVGTLTPGLSATITFGVMINY